MKWRQSNKQALDIQKESKQKSYVSHEIISRLNDQTDIYMVNSLLETLKEFASQGHLSKAFRIFSLIQGHALASSSCESIAGSLSSLLLSCTNHKLLPQGKQLHAQVITWGLQNNRALVPKLVSYYTAFGFLDDAHFIAAGSNILHPLPWNVLISSYVNRGHFEEAIFAYKQMVHKGVRPDHFTYPSVLKACAEQSTLDFGREVHKSIDASSLRWDLFVQNSLVSMYAKCGDLETSRSIFEKMPTRDQVSWNSIISGYASRASWDEAFKLFERMRAARMEINIITWNTVAVGCLKTGNFKGALELICQIRETVGHLDPVAVIIGLNACSHIRALRLGRELHGLAVRNASIDYDNVKNALITMYSRCGYLSYAHIMFRLSETKSIVTWNSIISGFAQWERPEEAMYLFKELLLAGIKPNFVTLAGILPLCARVANLRHGKEFHCYICRREEFQSHLLLWNSLIDMYARSGKVLTARKLFDLLENKDAVSYTSIIAGYGMQGNGKVAVKLFEQMIRSGIKPDRVAMVAILSGCSHSGLVAQGQLFFEKMVTVFSINPDLEHYSCMADLYGRASLLRKAKDIILGMPYEPTPEMWATLIGACRIHGDTNIGEWAAEKLLEMRPQNSGYYVLIANMYAAAGCWGKLAKVRSFMRDLGVRKDPGCASVDTGDGFEPFMVEDSSNSQADELYSLLGGLTKQMRNIDRVVHDNFVAEGENLTGIFET
ncbi:Pentatricopeptide repeat-containing protein [Striga hermonthica]|uniref:Pentatricopeptide repeat-containing protein n=1 Tax=Striga hermonthica TaxID=68872 RepID=A0A9N7MNB3_STRHE|nr:Pentatricopeptide repeat-containing protein [Striga hermonthica]